MGKEICEFSLKGENSQVIVTAYTSAATLDQNDEAPSCTWHNSEMWILVLVGHGTVTEALAS
jgi:hypothetical protein